MKVELWWYQLIWIAPPPLLDTQGYLPKSRYMKIQGPQTCVVLPFKNFFYWHQRYGLHLVCQARCIDDLYSTSKYKVGPYSYVKFMINVWHQKQRGCICYIFFSVLLTPNTVVWKSIILNSIKVAGYINLLDISVVVFINIKDTDYIDILDLLPKLLFFTTKIRGIRVWWIYEEPLIDISDTGIYTFANLSATS